ncbi:MAG TPA: hypothetical protein VK968_11020, partial [Roseimicrobium sp.]|nr:hypothetical protein [Roseimicrobium sp.]
THVFHSSGTTLQQPSRHFHHAASLALYEASLRGWFDRCVLPRFSPPCPILALTPSPAAAPHSSLVHMFDVLQKTHGSPESRFFGGTTADSAWDIDVTSAFAALQRCIRNGQPVFLVGTAFSFVHLIDHLISTDTVYPLPQGSLVLETGGYKGRSRELPKAVLHQLITDRLGVSQSGIVVEYGMSELSSQAYDRIDPDGVRRFELPPWARAVMISPETGKPVKAGETGLIRIYDLANVWSVMAIQTEDLGIADEMGRFELLGRATEAEARGCSLMAV